MKKDSSPKVVLVTGASSGIGNSIACFLAKKGYRVYGTSRKSSNSSSEFAFLTLDVTQPESVKRAVAKIISEAGKIDILINNAGIGITGPLEETPNDEIKKAFDTNLFGPLNVIKEVLPEMRKQNSGLIINITSIAGYMGLPFRGIYSATKGALGLLTESFRMEIKDFNIKMSNVAPGDFATNIASGRYHAPVIKGSPYEEQYKKSLEIMNSHVDRGENPEVMAQVIFKIIQKENPDTHYKVGEKMQKFSIVLKHILPDKIFEKLLVKHYKL